MQKITNNLYRIDMKMVNAYLIDAPDGLILVDTGPGKGIVKKLEKELPEIGKNLQDLKWVFITHFHSDHTGGVQPLKQIADFSVIATQAEGLYLDGSHKPPAVTAKVNPILKFLMDIVPLTSDPFNVDRGLAMDETDLSSLYPGMQWVDLSGHTPGQAGLYLSKEKALIVGDALGGPLRLPMKTATIDMVTAIQRIHEITEIDFKYLCQGHGNPITDNPRAQIQEFLKTL